LQTRAVTHDPTFDLNRDTVDSGAGSVENNKVDSTGLVSLDKVWEDFFADVAVVADYSDGGGHVEVIIVRKFMEGDGNLS
jgi:hypothetical protein